MTITEVVELAAERVGADPKLFWGFAQALIDSVVGQLDHGVDVKIRGLGTFFWVDVPSKEMPNGRSYAAGRKLKFKPAKRLQYRRTIMCSEEEEGMTKYAVVLDDDKAKTASKKRPGHCPECDKGLDKGGACPTHGTEPFEPRK
jgi:nucleoid DNA-binding protein